MPESDISVLRDRVVTLAEGGRWREIERAAVELRLARLGSVRDLAGSLGLSPPTILRKLRDHSLAVPRASRVPR